MQTYGAVDLGATNTRALVAGPDGAEWGRARRSTPAADGATIASAVVDTLRRACETADVAVTDLAAVGVGSIGPLDIDAGAVVDSPNVPADRIDLVPALEAATDAPVTLRNDAIAGAHGERRFADLPENGVYLTLSTGVGAGAVVDGHVLGGYRGNAAEVGHWALVPDGRQCGCGGQGHWEAYCSGRGIANHARELAVEEPSALDPATLDAAAVFDAAGPTPHRENGGDTAGDPVADRVVADAVTVNVRGLAALAHAYAPETVSIGGAVALSNPDRVIDPLADRLADAGLAVPAPAVRRTPLGDDAGLKGALALVVPGD